MPSHAAAAVVAVEVEAAEGVVLAWEEAVAECHARVPR
jgi:hypothetical protein